MKRAFADDDGGDAEKRVAHGAATVGASLDESLQALELLVKGERNLVANLANASSLIFHAMPDLNWAGFYLVDAEDANELVLGPFQGKPACLRIRLGKGVCGTAAQMRKTLVVPDVHAFRGHIACDSASNSEIVVPLIKADGALLGVLDVDSPSLDRFKREEIAFIEAAANKLSALCWT